MILPLSSQCHSGHMGLPLGCAEIGAQLWGKHLKYVFAPHLHRHTFFLRFNSRESHLPCAGTTQRTHSGRTETGSFSLRGMGLCLSTRGSILPGTCLLITAAAAAAANLLSRFLSLLSFLSIYLSICLSVYLSTYLFRYDLPLEEVKNFRRHHSMTPGHPEFPSSEHNTPGTVLPPVLSFAPTLQLSPFAAFHLYLCLFLCLCLCFLCSSFHHIISAVSGNLKKKRTFSILACYLIFDFLHRFSSFYPFLFLIRPHSSHTVLFCSALLCSALDRHRSYHRPSRGRYRKCSGHGRRCQACCRQVCSVLPHTHTHTHTRTRTILLLFSETPISFGFPIPRIR